MVKFHIAYQLNFLVSQFSQLEDDHKTKLIIVIIFDQKCFIRLDICYLNLTCNFFCIEAEFPFSFILSQHLLPDRIQTHTQIE